MFGPGLFGWRNEGFILRLGQIVLRSGLGLEWSVRGGRGDRKELKLL